MLNVSSEHSFKYFESSDIIVAKKTNLLEKSLPASFILMF